jgi:hypothetical protein
VYLYIVQWRLRPQWALCPILRPLLFHYLFLAIKSSISSVSEGVKVRPRSCRISQAYFTASETDRLSGAIYYSSSLSDSLLITFVLTIF